MRESSEYALKYGKLLNFVDYDPSWLKDAASTGAGRVCGNYAIGPYYRDVLSYIHRLGGEGPDKLTMRTATDAMVIVTRQPGAL